VVVLMLPLYSC